MALVNNLCDVSTPFIATPGQVLLRHKNLRDSNSGLEGADGVSASIRILDSDLDLKPLSSKSSSSSTGAGVADGEGFDADAVGDDRSEGRKMGEAKASYSEGLFNPFRSRRSMMSKSVQQMENEGGD